VVALPTRMQPGTCPAVQATCTGPHHHHTHTPPPTPTPHTHQRTTQWWQLQQSMHCCPTCMQPDTCTAVPATCTAPPPSPPTHTRTTQWWLLQQRGGGIAHMFAA
jgi:hypothetical protein